MKQEKVKAPIEQRIRIACRTISTIAVAIFAVYFIVDCIFLHKAVVGQETLDWNEMLKQAAKWLAVIFIIAGSALIFTEVIWVIVEVINFKRDPKWNTYGIFIGSCLTLLGLVAIICASNFIKYDAFFIQESGSGSITYTHNDFMVFLSLLFIVCCFCLVVTWKKIDAFSINLVESDAKSIIRIFSTTPLLLLPFFIWLVLPVDIYVSTNNVIAEMLTTVMEMCFAAVFVGAFMELVIQFYKNIKLELKNNKPVIVLYMIVFLADFCLFVISQSFVNDLLKFESVWARTLSICVCQQVTCVAAIFLTVFDNKIINRKKHEDIYA